MRKLMLIGALIFGAFPARADERCRQLEQLARSRTRSQLPNSGKGVFGIIATAAATRSQGRRSNGSADLRIRRTLALAAHGG